MIGAWIRMTFIFVSLFTFSALSTATVIDVSGSDAVSIKTLPVKKVTSLTAKLPLKKQAVKKSAPAKSVVLTTHLPAFKGHRTQVNFDLPEAAVVIQEREAQPVANTEVQHIQNHEVKEAPLLEVTEQKSLKQALPDSDSFVEVPGHSPVSREYQESKPEAAAAVPAPQILPSYWPYSSQDSSVLSGSTSSMTSSADEQIHDVPAVDGKTETESAIDSEKAAEETAYSRPSTPVLATIFSFSHDEKPRRRIFVRSGYLNAQYSQLESDLKNGASVFGVSVSQVFTKTEIRLGIDVAHGLDQAISLRNTRMAMLRAEGLYHFPSLGVFHAFGGGALGVADIDVTSYHQRTLSNGDIVVRENAKGTALLAAPEVGIRALIGRDLSLDISAEYLLLGGGEQIAKLGGLLGEVALGFSF